MTKRIPLILVVFTLLSILSFYLAIPPLLNWQVHGLIDPLQCQKSSLQIDRPSWNRLLIRDLLLEDCPGANIQRLQVESLELAFDPQQLISQQQLQSAVIKGVHIELTALANQNSPAAASSPPEFATQLMGYWLQQLPMKQGSLELELLSFPLAEQHWQLDGQVDINHQRLQLKLNAKSERLQPLQLTLDWNKQEQLQLQLRDQQQQPLYQLQAKLAITNNQLQIKAQDQFDLTPALAVLSQLQLTPQGLAEIDINARGNSHWQLQAELPALLARDFQQASLNQELMLDFALTSNSLAVSKLSGPIEAKLQWSPQQLLWQLGPRTKIAMTIPERQRPHPALSRHWILSPTDNLQGRLSWPPGLSLDSDEGRLQLQSTSGLNEKDDTGIKSHNSLRLQAWLQQFHWQPDSAYAHFETEIGKQDLTLQTLKLNNISAWGKGLLALGQSSVSINLDSGSYLSAEQLRHQSASIKQLNLVASTPLQLQTDLKSHRWKLSPFRLNLASSDIHSEQFDSPGLSGQLTINTPDGKGSDFNGTLDISLYNPSIDKWLLTDLELSLPYHLSYPTLDFQLQGKLAATSLSFAADAVANLLTQQLKGNWTLPPTAISELAQQLPASLQANIVELQIHQGSVAAQGQISRQAKAGKLDWQIDGDAELKDLSLEQADWHLDGGRSLIQFSASPQLGISLQGGFWADSINGVIRFDSLSSGFSFSMPANASPQLSLHHGSFKLLGGNLALEPFSLPLVNPKTQGTIHLSYLDLDQLLALQPKTDIQGNGRLSGSLPFTLDKDGPHIKAGHIFALAPGGLLSYRPAISAGSNYGLDIALNALNNFHYRVLELGIDYSPDGTLLLDTALKGSNPDWQNGQPIDFNIRIEQNLLKLLQALQFSDRLTEGLDRKIQQRMN
ncbi:MAG: YdbH domain-containing protein [Motiliproteus sp.]